MGTHRRSKRRRSRRASSPDTNSSSSASSASSSGGESPDRRRRRRRRSSRHRESSRHARRIRRRDEEEEEEEERRERSRKRKERRRRDSRDEESCDDDPESIVRLILESFPDVAKDLKQLLQMIDNGQGVDVRGILNKSLVKFLKKLFWSLKLKESDDGVFLLPPMGTPTLEVIGSTIWSHSKSPDNKLNNSRSPNEQSSPVSNKECMEDKADPDGTVLAEKNVQEAPPSPPRRRLIGPEMPSRELLAAAAELTEAEALVREADLEADNELFIGPPPPAVVAEAESANEAERFEEVTRIVAAELEKPYDILGVNWKMSSDNIKKRYWKLSLMVHPDKCSHPQAHQAFVKLNQAFKDLQDVDKRKDIDEKIKVKEEQEAFVAELKSLREAAQWRRLQGISIEGDDELLAVAKESPKRDEWMTTLPPERKQGVSMHSTSFSRTTKEGRGDTSIWTDSPLDKAEKAKQTYLEAYNKAKALADADEMKGKTDADLVDKYNSSKRAKSLVQKHQEESRKPKKKAKQQEKEEWEGQHPWKPWDREKDLTAGRKKVNLDSENMTQGLLSRFSSGAVQRNFL